MDSTKASRTRHPQPFTPRPAPIHTIPIHTIANSIKLEPIPSLYIPHPPSLAQRPRTHGR
eukprot:1597372-Prymnesium_polylepis.2